MVSEIGQFVSRMLLATAGTKEVHPIAAWTMSQIRAAAIRTLGDPVTTYTHAGFELRLPLSHNLPYYRHRFPEYDAALGRLSRAVHSKHANGLVVDIGANVGDTAAVIRAASPAPILCIEGNDDYVELLRENVAGLGDRVYVERAFVGPRSRAMVGELRSVRGTARISTEGTQQFVLVSLEEILQRRSDLPAPRLVKIDTDGFDCPIVEGSMALWQRAKPVLFFEYDPKFYPAWDARPMWTSLASIGYNRLLVYNNIGELFVSLRVNEIASIMDLHAYFAQTQSNQYADVCLFHDDDDDIAESFHDGETEHYKPSYGDEKAKSRSWPGR